MRVRETRHDDDNDAIWAVLEPILRAGETHLVFVAEDGDEIVGTYFLCANHLGGGAHVANAASDARLRRCIRDVRNL